MVYIVPGLLSERPIVVVYDLDLGTAIRYCSQHGDRIQLWTEDSGVQRLPELTTTLTLSSVSFRWVPCCIDQRRQGGEWADCPNGAFPIPSGPDKGWRRGNSELLPALAQALSLEKASDIWVFSDGLSHLPVQVFTRPILYLPALEVSGA